MLLLAMGADPIPGLARAAQQGHAGLVELHLDMEADPDAPDYDGRRPQFGLLKEDTGPLCSFFPRGVLIQMPKIVLVVLH
jgi:hypothetical protein